MPNRVVAELIVAIFVTAGTLSFGQTSTPAKALAELQRSQDESRASGTIVLPAQSRHRDVITITNRQNLRVPESRVKLLHTLVRHAIAERFHVGDKKLEIPLVLVLGDETERTQLGAGQEADTIYLRSWAETKFVVSDLQLTLQHLVVHDQWEQLSREITERADQIAPVAAAALGGPNSR